MCYPWKPFFPKPFDPEARLDGLEWAQPSDPEDQRPDGGPHFTGYGHWIKQVEERIQREEEAKKKAWWIKRFWRSIMELADSKQ